MDPDHAADLLARERARVENSLAFLRESEAEDVAESGRDAEIEDRSAAIGRFETDEALLRRLEMELLLIGEAEARLREGTYGISVVSGAEIPDERLKAVPWADRTVEEQESSES